VFAGVPALLIAVAMLAAWFPAFPAAGIDRSPRWKHE